MNMRWMACEALVVMASIGIAACSAPATEPTTGNAPPPSPIAVASTPTPPSNAIAIETNGPPRPADPPDVVQLDVRGFRRVEALVSTEIAALENLFAQTSPEAPDRAALARRLAEDEVELETAAAGGASSPVAIRARAQAIKYYGLLANEYPSYPMRDEVYYRLGRVFERSGDPAEARRRYFALIQAYPASKYVPLAYLAFADIFFDEAARNPAKWDLAAKAYLKVLEYPPPNDTAYGYAWYKLAHVYWGQGDLVKTRDALEKAITFALTFPQIPKATKLGEVAEREMKGLGRSTPEADASVP